ncbi:ABC transporter B family member, partial [Trifolium medium]|nr:ABC transporter B family member [Trifolium medium]
MEILLQLTGSTSRHHLPVSGPENGQEVPDMDQDSKKNRVKDKSNKTVPFYKLFSFADSWDYLLMFVGTISAVANGVSMPLLTIIIGDAIDAFGGNVNTKQVVHQVFKVSLRFAIIGAGAFFAAFL